MKTMTKIAEKIKDIAVIFCGIGMIVAAILFLYVIINLFYNSSFNSGSPYTAILSLLGIVFASIFTLILILLAIMISFPKIFDTE